MDHTVWSTEPTSGTFFLSPNYNHFVDVVVAIFHLLQFVSRVCIHKKSKHFRKQFKRKINDDQINNISCRCVWVCVCM